MVVPDGAARDSVELTFVAPSQRDARPTTCTDLICRQEAPRRWSPVAQRMVLPDAVGSLLISLGQYPDLQQRGQNLPSSSSSSFNLAPPLSV